MRDVNGRSSHPGVGVHARCEWALLHLGLGSEHRLRADAQQRALDLEQPQPGVARGALLHRRRHEAIVAAEDHVWVRAVRDRHLGTRRQVADRVRLDAHGARLRIFTPVVLDGWRGAVLERVEDGYEGDHLLPVRVDAKRAREHADVGRAHSLEDGLLAVRRHILRQRPLREHACCRLHLRAQVLALAVGGGARKQRHLVLLPPQHVGVRGPRRKGDEVRLEVRGGVQLLMRDEPRHCGTLAALLACHAETVSYRWVQESEFFGDGRVHRDRK